MKIVETGLYEVHLDQYVANKPKTIYVAANSYSEVIDIVTLTDTYDQDDINNIKKINEHYTYHKVEENKD